jgi:hypothetical protein
MNETKVSSYDGWEADLVKLEAGLDSLEERVDTVPAVH